MTRGASSLSCSFSAKPAGGAAVLPSGTVAFITPGHKYAQKNYMKKAYGCEPKGFISQGLPLAAEVRPRSERKGGCHDVHNMVRTSDLYACTNCGCHSDEERQMKPKPPNEAFDGFNSLFVD